MEVLNKHNRILLYVENYRQIRSAGKNLSHLFNYSRRLFSCPSNRLLFLYSPSWGSAFPIGGLCNDLKHQAISCHQTYQPFYRYKRAICICAFFSCLLLLWLELSYVCVGIQQFDEGNTVNFCPQNSRSTLTSILTLYGGRWAAAVQQAPICANSPFLPACDFDCRCMQVPPGSTASEVFVWEAWMAQIPRLVILESQLTSVYDHFYLYLFNYEGCLIPTQRKHNASSTQCCRISAAKN